MSLFRSATASIFPVRVAIRYGILFLLITLLVGRAGAQPGMAGNVQLSIKGNLSLDSLTSLVHASTGVRFSFNSVKVKGSKLIFFPQGRYTVRQLLQHVHATTGLYYFPYKKYYIFQDNPPKPAPVAIAPASPKTVRSRVAMVQHAPVKKQAAKKPTSAAPTGSPGMVPIVERPSPPMVMVLPKDTLVHAPGTLQPVTTVPMDTSTPAPLKVEAPPQKKDNPVKGEGSASNSLFHFQTGFFSTEVLYANGGVEIGIRPIQAHFSFASNFEVSGPRVGLGSIIRNREETQWQLQASICWLKRTFTIDSASLPTVFKIKGQLYSAGIQWCRKLQGHWVLKVGLSYNLLHSTYYNKDDQERTLSGFPYFEQQPDKAIHLLHPPYMLSNSYSDFTTSNNKTWVGACIGFYYTLHNR